MKKMVLFFFLIFGGTTVFADSFVLNNQVINNNAKSKIVIQWAASVKEVEENNKKILQGKKLSPSSLQLITQVGKMHLTIPKRAEYFRVLVWSKGTTEPDLLTNWVDIVPNKIYPLTADYLVPRVLMSGMGC